MHEIVDETDVAALLRGAQQGDQRCWRQLVDRHKSLVWGVARAHSLNTADAEDVSQATWLLLAENLERVHTPEALSAWLATTARREALRLHRARDREAPAGLDGSVLDVADRGDGPENVVLRSATAAKLRQAFAQLPHRCQQLLRIVAVAPETSYAQVGEALGMARGTIGPKKSRCLAQLRERLVAGGFPEEAAG